ncbi:GNAT family N-acetyltransferase [Formosa sp. PL04]|uniref:GNAT family N-acetyltransferase n=1 Tax=Formosa sp. PL04 TaxID=3081755 RepID=UPI00298276BE|nr:GNAT family N-acetyltransferase [Formosa sp. PL04]MDW5289736.1 GNAT family N-acetyltransferase [Formosa sp. PL04]
MKVQTLKIDRLTTERLILIPFTLQLCKDFIDDDFSELYKLGFKKGKSWPDIDVIETLPKIVNNLAQVESPTGFESWMIIKKDTLEIIGDLGFKGFNDESRSVDIGYGILKEERRNGYAKEAAVELIGWALSTEIVSKITAQCELDNLSSVNLLKKLNFIEMKRDDEMIYWSLQNKEYKE